MGAPPDGPGRERRHVRVLRRRLRQLRRAAAHVHGAAHVVECERRCGTRALRPRAEGPELQRRAARRHRHARRRLPQNKIPLDPTSKGFQIGEGQTRKIPLGFYTDGATAPFTIEAFEADAFSQQGDSFSPSMNPSLTVSLDKTSGQNGEKAYLDVKVDEGDAREDQPRRGAVDPRRRGPLHADHRRVRQRIEHAAGTDHAAGRRGQATGGPGQSAHARAAGLLLPRLRRSGAGAGSWSAMMNCTRRFFARLPAVTFGTSGLVCP